jgi:hypothetical protein
MGYPLSIVKIIHGLPIIHSKDIRFIVKREREIKLKSIHDSSLSETGKLSLVVLDKNSMKIMTKF